MTPCREWQGATNGRGYGVRQNQRYTSRYAHRQIMEMVHGPEAIEGRVIMHLCDNPLCFRYDHLRIGTHTDNLRDMSLKGRGNNQHKGKTHCPQGHPYNEPNTRIDRRGKRHCRECDRIRQQGRRRTQP